LHEVDDVAYVRFASVYHSFQRVDEFAALLRDLQAEREGRR
ncbi:MAG: transcriptional regulator NrdR, partial [Candidatus Krumholzibacteriia bacterium]